MGNLYPRRDFLDVRDVAQALQVIGHQGKDQQAYNICSGKSVSMQAILDIMMDISGKSPEISTDPARINPHELEDLVGDNTKLREELAWRPMIPLQKSIEDLLKSVMET